VWTDADADGGVDAGEKSEITRYTWDGRNRLVRVAEYEAEEGSAAKVITYYYDVENRWIGQTTDRDGDGTVDHTRWFGYDGNQIIVQFDKEGSGDVTGEDLSHRYLWGPAVDQILADEQLFPLGPGEYPGSSFSSPWVESGTRSFPLPPGEGQGEGAAHGGGYDLSSPGRVLWPLADHLGTVRDLAQYDAESAMTAVVDHRQYDSFGNLVAAIDPATNQAAAVDFLFGFTGRPFDSATGLQNNLNRWYDPTVGRWLSPDPLGLAAGDANLYRYCGNSPANGVDRSGLSKVTIIIKQGGKVIKTLRLSTEEAIRYLRNKTRNLAGRNIFANVRSRPGQLAQDVSSEGKAVYHAPNAQGHPGHYHPAMGESAAGNPVTRNTPHIGDQYRGNAAVLPLLAAGAKELKEIVIELSPAGDIRTIVVDGPELAAALRETLQILCVEAGRDAYLRSTTGSSNMFRAIDPNLAPPAKGGFPTRAGDWRKPGFWSEGG